MENNLFINEIGIGSSRFYNDKIDLEIKYDPNYSNENQTIGFFLANMIAYHLNSKNSSRVKRKIEIDKIDEDIYIIKSSLSLDAKFLSSKINYSSGQGIVYKLDDSYEILYKEKNQKYHYKFIIDSLDNNGKLIEAINCIDRKIMECFLVDDFFEINGANNSALGGKGFKPLFKVRY